jgi:hypothetical protein
MEEIKAGKRNPLPEEPSGEAAQVGTPAYNLGAQHQRAYDRGTQAAEPAASGASRSGGSSGSGGGSSSGGGSKGGGGAGVSGNQASIVAAFVVIFAFMAARHGWVDKLVQWVGKPAAGTAVQPAVGDQSIANQQARAAEIQQQPIFNTPGQPQILGPQP